ncbi:MAG: hypothetical protein CFK52_02230 [Chloracidobacterium sp. CP2_5A]|nr:MAG: hypothetical protein CFK52_02230 [Chloracidobacterium sp. CP2_5A]
MSAAKPQPGSSASRRWRRLALVGAVIPPLLFSLLFAAPRLIPSGWLIPRLESLLGQALSAPVRIANAQATSFLPLTVAIQDVTLGQNRPDDRLAGVIRRAEFGIGWLDLFRRRPSFTHLTVTEADLRLASGAASAAARRLSQAESAVMTLWVRADAPTGKADEALAIERLQVRNSRLQWTNTPLAFERLETEGRVAGREVALGRTTAAWLGGALDAAAIRLTFEPARLGFAVTGRLADIAVEQLTSPPEKPAAVGAGTFRLDVTGQYAYEKQAFEDLGGSGDAALRNGRLTRVRPGTIGRVMEAPSLPARIGGFDLSPLRERWLGAPSAPAAPPAADEGLAFQQLAFRFALEGTTVKLSGLTCDLEKERQVTGQGTISLAERPSRIDFDLQFPLTFLTGGGTLPLLDALGERQIVPVRVTGTFERPVIEILGLRR